jgi:hypothetical protein
VSRRGLPSKATVERQIGATLVRGWILDGAGPARYGWGILHACTTTYAGRTLLDVVSRHGRGLIAAIGSDGTRPVVWGVGSGEDAAREDAARWLEHPQPLICCEVTAGIATRIEAGEVDCRALGIAVRVDRDGEIIDAEVRS